MVVVPVCLNDVVLQNAWVLYDINKDEGDESLPLLACNFFKIFKKKSECPIGCLLWGGTLPDVI